MNVMKFHRTVYRGAAIDEAVKVFSPHATFKLTEDATHWLVELSVRNTTDLRRVSGEFANYALGLTISGPGE